MRGYQHYNLNLLIKLTVRAVTFQILKGFRVALFKGSNFSRVDALKIKYGIYTFIYISMILVNRKQDDSKGKCIL